MDTKWVTRIGVLLGIVMMVAAGASFYSDSKVIYTAKADGLTLKKITVWRTVKGKHKKKMDAYIASGAGTSFVNGTYTYTGETTDGPRKIYSQPGTEVPEIRWYGSAGINWMIKDGGAPISTAYYTNPSTSLTPPLTGWVVASGTYPGTPPAPTLAPVSDYATPPAPKITNIHDGDAFTLYNSLPWDASWTSSHRLTLAGLGALNDTDTTFAVPSSGVHYNEALSYKFAIEDSGGVEGPETKIVSCPQVTIDIWDVVVPSSLPSGGHNLKLQTNHFDAAYHEDEWVDIATGLVADQRIRIANMIPRLAMVRYYCEFAGGYGGQNGSDEFSVSAAVQWPGKVTGGFSDF